MISLTVTGARPNHNIATATPARSSVSVAGMRNVDGLSGSICGYDPNVGDKQPATRSVVSNDRFAVRRPVENDVAVFVGIVMFFAERDIGIAGLTVCLLYTSPSPRD